MKHNHPHPLLLLMPLRTLRAATRVRLHPEFVKYPVLFARRHGVDLVGEVFPATSFTTNSGSNDKDESVKANIHLVQHKAIRLFTERDTDGDWIRTIDLCPAILLYGIKDHPVTGGDLTAALSRLRDQVTPLLADPMDARHVVPGLVTDDPHVAYWRSIQSEVLVPGVEILSFHTLSHPNTGPVEGATDERLKLGDRGDCIILIESAKWQAAGPHGMREVHGVRVRLSLRGNALVSWFRTSGNTALIGDIIRLISFRPSDVARVHQEVMSQLSGIYLPVPPEWSGMGKALTPAKVIALLSKLTPIPPEELRAMHEAQSNPSRSTQKRMSKDVAAAADCLKPVAVSTLFPPELYAAQGSGTKAPINVHINPQIAAAYGPLPSPPA